MAASSQYSSSWPFAVQQEPITACNLFSGCHHFPNVCPFDYWSNSSPQPDKYSSMRNRPSRDKIRFLLETEHDMYLNEQDLDQWIQEKNQEAEEEIKLILQKRLANTISAIPLNSVEVKDEEYMSDYEESEGEFEVSQSESEIVMAQTYQEEAEKEIEVTLTRPEDLKQESKDDQSFLLLIVKAPVPGIPPSSRNHYPPSGTNPGVPPTSTINHYPPSGPNPGGPPKP
ncbi:hypothetical protein Sjap_005143 [Stephania japonica]|uniref:Uncharacterized protein n=1 Tax=Stephania japonica TaxID=461633 RepID=A0AAP0PKV5_9MAGN